MLMIDCSKTKQLAKTCRTVCFLSHRRIITRTR